MKSEGSTDILDALLNSYIKKIIQKQKPYETLNDDTPKEILGFVHGLPVHPFDTAIENDDLPILGFTKSGRNCCIFNNKHVYQSVL